MGDKSSLADTAPYASPVGRTIVPSAGENRHWTLRDFSSGDRFLQYSPQLHELQAVARPFELRHP